MTERQKALVVVLVLALAVFICARPIALKFTDEADFKRRRNVWFLLTIVVFLSPTFWWYAAVAAPLCFWAARKDHNPLAFYLLMLHVAPAGVEVITPLMGVNSLVDMSNYRLLAVVVLLPVALQLRRTATTGPGLRVVDAMVLGYALLQVVLFVPGDITGHVLYQDTTTNMLRRAMETFLDICLVYYVASRHCRDRKSLLDAAAALCLSGVVLSVIGMFEAVRHWLLYFAVGNDWAWAGGLSYGFTYLMRSGVLRASASAGHTLALGYIVAVSLGLWLVLKDEVGLRWPKLVLPLLFIGGEMASFSRGPMLGAVIIWLLVLLLRPEGMKRRFQGLAFLGVIFVVVALSPLGSRIQSVIPMFGGDVDAGNIDYRQRLAERSWEIILQHPWFGDQAAYLHMTDLRQGQGIIDFVNTYAETAVFYGLVGAVLLFGGMFLSLFRLVRVIPQIGRDDPGMGRLGAGLAAIVAGTLVMLYTMSFIGAYRLLYFMFLGLAVSYLCMNRPQSTQPALSSDSPG